MRKHKVVFGFAGLIITARIFLVNRLVGKQAIPFPSGVCVANAFHVPFAQPLRCLGHVVGACNEAAIGFKPIRRITAVTCQQYGGTILE